MFKLLIEKKMANTKLTKEQQAMVDKYFDEHAERDIMGYDGDHNRHSCHREVCRSSQGFVTVATWK
jgi:hypothetical protein